MFSKNRTIGQRLTAMVLSLAMVLTMVGVPAKTVEAEGEMPQVVSDDVAEDINATVKLFNYDDTINQKGLGPQGYVFFHGDYVKDDDTDVTEGTVDGKGTGSNDLNQPVMKPLLVENADGEKYPYAESGTSYSQSFDYLFSEANGYHKGTMTDGGGLFRYGTEGALKGYYYYDSAINSAYYNQSQNKFTLYDCVVRPYYTAINGTDVQRANFLPFNKVLSDDGTTSEVTIDTTLSTGVKAAKLNGFADLWFGMTTEFEFYMPKDGKMGTDDMIFDFYGDDDVFVYIDDVLVLNINGTHGAEKGTINFNTGATNVTRATKEETNSNLKAIFDAAGKTGNFEGNTFADYTKHTLKFYYMERGGNISYCRLKFNMPTLPPNSLTVGKELTVSGDATDEEANFIQNSLSYQFRVWKSEKQNELFVKPGDTYDILEAGSVVGTGTVDKDGYFSLKASQQAQFKDMLVKGEGDVNYYVEEILPAELAGQYGEVEYTVDEQVSGTTRPEGGEESEFASIQTGSLTAEDSQIVTFKNKVDVSKLGTLKITKEKTQDAQFEEGQIFNMQVKLGGQLLPEGTKYKVGQEERTVAKAGIIPLKIGEIAILEKMIISGTEYSVTELIGASDKYSATYSGNVNPEADDEYKPVVSGTGVSGKMPLNSTVDVVVTNENFDFSGEIPIAKRTIGNTKETTFNFVIEEVEKDTWEKKANAAEVDITVNNDESVTKSATIAYDNAIHDTTFYYKVYETSGDGPYIYDDTFYVVEMNIGKTEAAIGKILKNGTEEVYAIEFVNQKTTSIIVDKKVNGTPSENAFDFEAVIGEDKETFAINHNEKYEIENIPVGAQVTITEDAGDYVAFNKVGNGTLTKSNEVTVTATEATIYVHYENVNYAADDTVVIDYGLDVDVDVLSNDRFPENADLAVTLENNEGTKGTYGIASVQKDSNNRDIVHYSLNKKDDTTNNKQSGMKMSTEDTFKYNVKYTSEAYGENDYSADLIVIPATSLYFEDNFVTYNAYSWNGGTAPAGSEWTDVTDGSTSKTTQAEDRPGESLDGVDANNIYGFDAAYSNFSKYSNGSAKKVTVKPQTSYATAEFTFTGTGFDIVSLTSNKTGTIVAKVEQEQADGTFKTVKSKIVDTYYGYKYVPHKVTYEYIKGEWIEKEAVEVLELDENDKVPTNPEEVKTYAIYENRWVVDKSGNDNSLYQIPVLKVDDLNYGTYRVTLSVSHASLFDHEQTVDGEKAYDFYLDAIRIYDPANDGATSETVQIAYVEDKEGWPEYHELRNKLITVGDFNAALDAEKVAGAVFIDGKDSTSEISDYTHYGPNNEVYLAANQAIAFEMNFNCNKEKIHLAYKLAQGNPQIKIYAAEDVTSVENVTAVPVNSATDMYHDITDLNGKTVVIANVGEGILSITNIKVTHNAQHTEASGQAVFTMRRTSALRALATLKAAEPQVKQGLVKDEDGHIRYYEDGVAIYKGLVKDADGNYYYVNSTKKAVKNCTYGIGEKKANGLLPAGTYQFDAEGKMIDPPPTGREGLTLDKDGHIRYYENNVAVYKGLVQDDEGNYYYINSTKKAVKNCKYGIGAGKANGLLPAGTYQFDADGKMVR